ncbi:osteoclast stimulatory transmembrane protein [Hyperolius riggenbachi]|uniref:osteoclast stimulatory transmembrane protein n=1 Tax=Hyperolius riggenbachi TaxID=752182 RepID=UPI0035A3A4F7
MYDFALEILTAYSTPVPETYRQTFLLLVTCFSMSSAAGTLLYLWMFHSLQYDFLTALILSTMFACLVCGILILIHPIRCMLTIIIPTLSTRQGSRLLLSTCFMIIALNIIPNILKNLKAIFHIFRCISQHSTEQVLNSTETFRELAYDVNYLVAETTRVIKSFNLKSVPEVNICAQINSTEIASTIGQAGNKLKDEFETVECISKAIMLIGNRVMAGFFIAYILFSATWYLWNYLTDIQFDNKYITSQLVQMAEKNKMSDLPDVSSFKLIKSTGFKMSRKEFGKCLFRCVVILLFVLLTTLIILTDHIVFQFALLVSQWAERLPALQVMFDLEYTADVEILNPFRLLNLPIPARHNVVKYTRCHRLDVTFFPALCQHSPSRSEDSTVVTIGFIYCILFAMVLLEAYAQRLCRKISALFYQQREEERILYLFNQIQKNCRDKLSSDSPRNL